MKDENKNEIDTDASAAGADGASAAATVATTVKTVTKTNCFSAKVYFDLDKYCVDLEFPINHININFL